MKPTEQCILDDVFTFMDDHVAAEREQIITTTLYAAATHAIRQCATFPRLLFTSELESSGKTHYMNVTSSVSANPMDAEGTPYALSSAMLAATNEPEKQVPSLFYDEISDILGKSGQAGSKNPVCKYLRKGYKHGATDSVSINRVQEKYSIFTPFAMTGLRTAVPRDIRSRCLVILCVPGKPRRYWDVRESEPYAAQLQLALRSHVEMHLDTIGAFRARGIHPKLTGRKLEIWEPLFAVAYALGGQRWLTYARDAFAALALSERDVPVLTPSQTVIRDVASAASKGRTTMVTSDQLADELARLDDKLYVGRTHHSLICLIRDAFKDHCRAQRVTIDGTQVRAYRASDLTEAWELVRPDDDYDDAEVPEETDDLSDLEEVDLDGNPV